MCADSRVNSDDQPGITKASEILPESPRWWLRHPVVAIMTTAVLGFAAVWVTLSLGRPDSTPGSTLIYIVVLPMALLLPAIALAGALVAWRSFQATSGKLRLVLAIPAATALVLNTAAAGLFIRWAVLVFSG